jgi:hypothetical protein
MLEPFGSVAEKIFQVSIAFGLVAIATGNS